MHTLNLRSFLWFATGVALTVTSVATFGAWRADAAVTPGESTFVPVAPCRLFDTRPGENVPGSVTTPIGVAETRTQQVTGSVGNCNIAAGAAGVAMNVTILNPTGTGDSFLTLFPADETTLPVVSNLNWSQGQGATPNKVDVKLSPDGKIKIYNNVGTIDVIGDIVGYYRSSTITDLEARLLAAEAQLSAQASSVESLLADDNVIPSGKSITGLQSFDGATPTGSPLVGQVVELHGRVPVPLTDEQVNGSATSGFADADPSCDGSFAAPTAPAGKLCINPDLTSLNTRNVNLAATVGAIPTVLADDNFVVIITPGAQPAGSPLTLRFSWTYTAP